MGMPLLYPLFLALLLSLMVFSLVRAARPLATPKSWVMISALAWLAALLVMTVRPGTGIGVRVNLTPVLVAGPGAAVDAVKNVFVFVPIGMLLALLGWRLIAALAAALAVSLSVEVIQYVTNWGRTADVNDLLTNGVGAVIGWVLIWAIQRTASTRRSMQSVETPPAVY